MSNHDDTKPQPGTTNDPNQANKTGLPRKDDVEADRKPDHGETDDPRDGAGSTNDPNQANRT